MLFKISFGLLTLSMVLAVACADDPSADDSDESDYGDLPALALRAGDAGTPPPEPTFPWPFPAPTTQPDAAAPTWPTWPFPEPSTPPSGDAGTRDSGRPPLNPFDPSTW
jgi:hypothetical protein